MFLLLLLFFDFFFPNYQGSNPKQSRLTKRVQDIVNWQNIEHLHYRIQFDPLLPEFIHNLINNNIQLCMVRNV